jgi:uncharacterized DUF497 family protein
MIKVEWYNEKNDLLKRTRNICFEDIEQIIIDEELIDVVPHFNLVKFPNQKILIVKLNDYIHYVPFVLRDNVFFLKTIVPSRKLNKIYNIKD